MPVQLADLVDPSHTAVVTSEVQRGVVDGDSMLPQLAAAAGEILPVIARLLDGARAAGAEVVHCLFARRADGRGANTNGRLFKALGTRPVSPEVVAEVGARDSDIQLSRYHGLSPMANTDLDPVLRNLGVRTVIVTGVSVNVAVTNLAFDAVNAGYQVVIPRDAVAGLPAAYVDAVFDHTLSLVATVTTVDDVLAAWSA